jgi:hypothetical protein
MEAPHGYDGTDRPKLTGPALWFLLYFCLFSLKFPLFGGTVNGPALRVDDLLIAVIAPALVVRAYRAGLFRGHKRLFLVLLFFVGEGMISALWSIAVRATDPLTAVAYALRPLEYASFVAVGFLIAKSANVRLLDRALQIYAIYFSALCALQVAGVNLGASQFDFSRAAGNTSGPYEAAVVAAFLMFYFIARRRWLFVVPPTVALILTQSRITTVAVIIVAVLVSAASAPRAGRIMQRVLLVGLTVALGAGYLALGLPGSSFVARLEQTQVGASWAQASAIRASTPAVTTPAQYQYYAYDRLLILQEFNLPDASSVIRFTRWQIELKAWASDPTAILFGLGPSFTGAATDGFYVRVLVGQGIVGTVLFLAMLAAIWQLRRGFPGSKHYMLVLVFTGGFIDVFVSYRPMMFMWIGAGVALASLPVKVTEKHTSRRLAAAQPRYLAAPSAN